MEQHNYTVYMHICPNDKKYIGITKQKPQYRWGRGSGYSNNKHFINAIKKYGWDNIKHIIIFTNLAKEQAEKKEIELIKYYKSNEQKYGYNILKGGNVSNGLSKEVIEKISKKKKGIPLKEEHKNKIRNSLIGRKMSDEWKTKISKSLIGKNPSKESIEKNRQAHIGKTAWNKGKTNIYTKEQIDNLSIKAKKLWEDKNFKEKHCKKVKCIELNIIFNSLTEASNYFKMNNTSHISDCCKKKTKSCGKYNGKKLHWKYVK